MLPSGRISPALREKFIVTRSESLWLRRRRTVAKLLQLPHRHVAIISTAAFPLDEAADRRAGQRDERQSGVGFRGRGSVTLAGAES